MKRHVIIASHSMLSRGMAETLKFFEGEDADFEVVTAYVDNRPIEGRIGEIFDKIPAEDEFIVMTDLMAGSVNQKFMPYAARPHTHVLTGMNLSLAMALTMEPSDSYVTEERVEEIVDEARSQVQYVNVALKDALSEDDEDE